MKIILTLNGLDCANCANKIIEQIQNTPGIKKAQLNFVTKQLKYETDIDKKTSINIITDIVTSIENDVKVQEFSSINHGHEEEKNDILRIIFALILFVASLLIQNKYMSFYAVAASYIIVGYDVVFKAFKNILKGKALDESFLMTIATIGAFYIGQYTEGVAVRITSYNVCYTKLLRKAILSFVPTPSVPETSTGFFISVISSSYSPPKPPIPDNTLLVIVLATCCFISSTALYPAVTSTPACL